MIIRQLNWCFVWFCVIKLVLCVVLFTLQIVGDAVGWGFVVRGSKPCHIQAVDPGGPAAAAGMKVLRFYTHRLTQAAQSSTELT